MDQFVEDQEKEARAQMDVLVADYQDMLERLQLAHDRKLNELKVKKRMIPGWVCAVITKPSQWRSLGRSE
jgi:hypothetical protein